MEKRSTINNIGSFLGIGSYQPTRFHPHDVIYEHTCAAVDNACNGLYINLDCH